MNIAMLTTEDNPFDPFDQWDEWFAFDSRHGYHTPGYLARIVRTSDDLSYADQHRANEIAIDEIIEEHGGRFYKKVTREMDAELSEVSES